ncbi:probable adenylate cyclase [Cephalotrichum gorgonifer]|uniref:Adenylate cyclase n=1 Tax=Cephalotrichum gorgonifer TaxID=2041049 RepID=A0AAE8SQP0_9PEZI|nr:probable adenylate cyclase [Cephalotrichum gorgonifer]
MTRKDGTSRFSSVTSSSTDSGRSTGTIKAPTFPSSALRKAVPKRLKMEDAGILQTSSREDPQVSPTSTTFNRPHSATANPSSPDRRMSDLTNYRQDLAVLDSGGPRVPRNQQNTPSTAPVPLSQVAPWAVLPGNGASGANSQSSGAPRSFYNDSSDNVSLSSQVSPNLHTAMHRAGSGSQLLANPDSPDAYEDRRPSFASITTLSSQGSKNSLARGGLRKLQGFFGEEFPGSDTSLPPAVPPKDDRPASRSHSRVQRGRNQSNATDYTREVSPAPSRPRTPVPAPEVVPFLYQEPDDIARYGEAPVRDIPAGPDRNRFMSDAGLQNPPKTASSTRSGHSITHLPGHRHNRSIDDPRSLRPSTARDDSIHSQRDRGGSATAYSGRSRAHSPAPSPALYGKAGSFDGQTSPGHAPRRRLLSRLRRNKDKDEEGHSRLRDLPRSTRSLASKASRSDLQKNDPPLQFSPDMLDSSTKAATFNNKFPFSKKPRAHRTFDVNDEPIGPTDQTADGTVFYLDTDLRDMNGILNRPPALAPMDPKVIAQLEPDEPEQSELDGENPSWNAPVSWAVRRTTEDNSYYAPDAEDLETPVDEENMAYYIRIFKSDGSFTTQAMPLTSTVSDVVDSIGKKMAIPKESLPKYYIVLRKRDVVRILSSMERPFMLQKKLLQQFGFDERDRLEDLGREDNSYLCRFTFLSAIELESQQMTTDLGLGRLAKVNHVDLSGRNLFNIPLSLYSKAADIVSLNISRNLSLDVPRDFIQSCTSLRDIKFNNNEARKLPASLSRASKLTYLDASNNRLELLDQAELDNLGGLLKLSLANNRLTDLPPYFGAYKSLRTLNLSSNFLDKFPDFLCELDSLVDLDLSFNSISILPDNIGKLQNMERFVITNNRLSDTLPCTFKQLISLRELDIKYNAITSIDIMSELPKLEVLSVDHNSVSVFKGSFETLRNLRLNSNPVNKFEITHPVLTLKSLNIANAQLASMDVSFHNMPYLESLILDNNYFVSLPPQIGKLGRLEYFSIAENHIGALPPQIGCLTELRTLDIRGNSIPKLPMEIWWANKLETLNASSNVLVNFPKPASRPPRVPGEEASSPPVSNGRYGHSGTLTAKPSMEDLNDPSRRPSQASSTLLSVGPSPVPGGTDRKSSVVSVYGKGGRQTSVVSRSTSAGTISTTGGRSTPRKDSTLSARLANTFAGSLRTLSLADNQLDDDVFDKIVLLPELRVLNLSYNEIGDVPQRLIKSWPQLVELYLSGNELTSLPADDLEENSLLQVLHINANRFTNLPADISRARKLAVLDCGSNYLKYNISNVPYDWNWNLNPDLRYLNLSGNKRLEIKQTAYHPEHPSLNREQYTDFSRLQNLRILGLMDVTLTQPRIPDQSEDRRVRTSGSQAGHLPYGMADTLGKNEHLSTIDLVVPRFNSSESEMLLGLFDGQALSSGGSKIAKHLHENFGRILTAELKTLRTWTGETPSDALRRVFLALNKDLANIATQHVDERSFRTQRRGTSTAPPLVLSAEDVRAGGVATVIYLRGMELYVANVGDAQAMLITEGTHKILTRKHDPAEPSERQRIREAGGWVSRHGLLNDQLDVSRAFGYVNLMPAVQAAPHVSHITIREQDDIIVVGTKELWEYLSHRLVVDVARAERGDLMRAAQKLRDLAIAYGASGKIMVMMISVADLKRRVERSRGRPSMLWPSGLQDDLGMQVTKRAKKKGVVLDSTLQRLEAEIPAPTGNVSIVFTDIKNSTTLWEMYPSAMRSAIKLHNEQMRRQLRHIGGYEVKTEGDAFMVSFPTATSALLWCFAVQMALLEVNWPAEMVNSISGQPIYDKDSTLIFKGLSVRMGIHFGEAVSETDPVTRRMDYFGPMVNKASRVSAVADGGQITVSSDFISEIQRCLESYQETDRTGSGASAGTSATDAEAGAGAGGSTDDDFEDEHFAASIRKDLRALSSQGFEVKDMGEKKLKGLENPEVIYSLYPHALVGRIEYHQAHERGEVAAGPPPSKTITAAVNGGGTGPSAVDPDIVWALWKVGLRLEMMCSSLESPGDAGPHPPEMELLERVKMGGDVTEVFLVHFLEHQVSRIEASVNTLAMRHIAAGKEKITSLSSLQKPMGDVLKGFQEQLEELRRYKELFGPLESRDDEGGGTDDSNGAEESDGAEGSDTD